ncbi:hypothetical protein [Halodesulfovibrio marinisediminis]|uniref:Uncharacterized protein n=1 Tax=Halodesulfovibrio marinisediminis DSM 17456 TaxID=1121457 RepID=A0A1N6IX12_9BACT|nr:hypothetical protein [Halodesulfovibrio marinisediminis]SIO36517.1 hypothetical protein SAMN02745161_3015 [Halodesulfovibrio marinisediminis DSM 17456]
MNEVIVVTVNNETFLMAADKELTKDVKIELESICESLDEDYADEVSELDTFQLCEWFENKVREELSITLKPVGIGLELNLNNL